MEMNEIVSAIANNGAAIIVIAYFMYRDNKFMTQLQQTLQSLLDAVNTLKDVAIKTDNEDF